MEESISVLSIELSKVLKISKSLLSEVCRHICNNMKVIVTTLIHYQLLCGHEFEGSLEKVKYLFEQFSVEVVDEVTFPIPYVIILVCQQVLMVFHLLFCRLCGLWVSFLQVCNQLCVVLIQVYLIGNDPHAIGYLLGELLYFLEFF